MGTPPPRRVLPFGPLGGLRAGPYVRSFGMPARLPAKAAENTDVAKGLPRRRQLWEKGSPDGPARLLRGPCSTEGWSRGGAWA